MLSQPWCFPGWQNTLLNQNIWKTGNLPILPDLLMSWMPLTSECPGWSSISRKHPSQLAMWLSFCCHGFTPHPTLAQVSLIKCSATRARLPGPLLSWLNMLQQHLLAKKESHTKHHRERLQVQPQPEPASPQNVEGKMTGCILLAADPVPAAASWADPPAALLLNKPQPACRPNAAHSPHRPWPEFWLPSTCLHRPVDPAPPPTHCPRLLSINR